MTTEEKIVKVAENREKLYEAGKKAEYDTFWNTAQNRGKRTNYQFGFAGHSWNDVNFLPKYDIIFGTGCNQAFNGCLITNLTQRLRDCGVILDTSKNDNNDYMFNGCSAITHIPTIDLTGQNPNRRVANYTFNVCRNLVEIEKVIVPSDGSMIFTSTFGDCGNLVEVSFGGVIGKTISFASSSKLSVKSMIDIIMHLANHKGTASEYAYSVKFHATALARLESVENGYWIEYIDNLGWTT